MPESKTENKPATSGGSLPAAEVITPKFELEQTVDTHMVCDH